jgi:hypothetical protein
MGISLLATLANNVEKGRALPFLDWLCAQRFGQGPQERNAVLDQPLGGANAQNLVGYRGNQPWHPGPAELPPYLQSASQGTLYSLLELGKIQPACSLEDAEFNTEKPNMYGRMLTKGRKTIARVRALLEDILRPQGDMSTLLTVVVHVTDNLARDVKELNFGYQNDRTIWRGMSMTGRMRRVIGAYRRLQWLMYP